MQQPPKNRKFRKAMKGRNRGQAKSSRVCFGEFGLKSIGRSRITAVQIESARRAMNRFMKRDGQIWIRVFPDHPVSKKPLEVRQGKGKGNVEFYVFNVKPGTVVFEIAGVSKEIAARAFELASSKLPFKTKMIQKEEASDGNQVA